MKVKATQTTTQKVEVELDQKVIDQVVYAQTTDVLARALMEKIKFRFISNLPPAFGGERTVRPSFKSGQGACLVLVHVDADIDYHHNVGIDREIRVLTEVEANHYREILDLFRHVDELNTK